MRKKWGSLGIGLCLVLSLSGCTLFNMDKETPIEEPVTFGFTGVDLTDPAYRAALVEVQSAAEANGDAVITFDPQLDNERQIEGIKQMLDQGIDLLFLGPVDVDGILPALKACREAQVPVICFDSQVSDSEYTAAFIGGDNYQLGVLIGEQILKDHPEGGKLGMLNNPLARSVTSRVQGILDTLEGSAVEVVASAEVTLYEEVLPAAETLLSEYPEINILWGFNDDITLLMHSLVLAAGRQDRISLYGTGSLYHDAGTDILLQAVEKGFVRAASVQSPAQWGVLLQQLGYQLLSGKTLKAEYLTDSQIINQDNLDNYETEE